MDEMERQFIQHAPCCCFLVYSKTPYEGDTDQLSEHSWKQRVSKDVFGLSGVRMITQQPSMVSMRAPWWRAAKPMSYVAPHRVPLVALSSDGRSKRETQVL